MPEISLTCPVCNFSKKTNVSVVPPSGTTVTCPVCKSLFPFQLDEPAEDSPAGPPPSHPSEEGAASPPPQPAPRATRRLTFEFTGNAKEYFGIWIVNTLLRIVTFGLYSPWAKVRKRRYFYGNTLLDGAPFDFLADPLAILKGWFIAGLFFGLYSFASQVSPILGSVLMLVIFGVFPWVVVRSRIFNLRNTTHRNIHFGFNPDYREAYRVFLWWQLLLPFTLGILAPYIFYRQKRFLVENTRYGTTPFCFHATPGEYYRVFLPLVLLFPVALIAFGGIGAGLGDTARNEVGVFVVIALFFLAYMAAGLYIQTALTNLTWNSTTVGGHRFECSLRTRDLLWIYFSSAVAIVCSLGLLGPWAAVRLVRYRLERLTATGVGFDSIIASADEQTGAAPEELGDMLGFDLGI